MCTGRQPGHSHQESKVNNSSLALSFSLPDLLDWHFKLFQHSPVFSRLPCISRLRDRERNDRGKYMHWSLNTADLAESHALLPVAMQKRVQLRDMLTERTAV